jgi:hypothetical protein
MFGEGDGREVRCGFCARAAESVAWDSGGVIKVISKCVSYDTDFSGQIAKQYVVHE